jgi:hypothetical protein
MAACVSEIMSAPKEFNFFRLWRWTLELYSLALVTFYWMLLFTGSEMGSKFHYNVLFDGSLTVMVLLMITAVLSLRRHKWHACVSFVIFLLWLVWAALPRL